MGRRFMAGACVATAVALCAAALQAQSSVSVAPPSPPRTSMAAALPLFEVNRMQSAVPATVDEQLRARLAEIRDRTAQLVDRLRFLREQTRAGLTECPMPVMKTDSVRDAEMPVASPDTASSSKWVVQGRIIGCFNPLQR